MGSLTLWEEVKRILALSDKPLYPDDILRQCKGTREASRIRNVLEAAQLRKEVRFTRNGWELNGRVERLEYKLRFLEALARRQKPEVKADLEWIRRDLERLGGAV